MADMEVQVSAQTRTALKADLTLRCLLRAKFHRDASRRSADVIPWAQSLIERLSSAVLQEVEQQTAGCSIQINMIQMLRTRNVIYICYDLFLNECDQRIRSEISESGTKRPIHYITQKGKVYIMRRDERLDAKVAQRYVHMNGVDKGPRPFFSDLKHPPFYNQHGQRIENWGEIYKLPEGSEPEGSEPEGSEPEGSEPEGDGLKKKSEGRKQDRLGAGIDLR
ncbi:hypothetical protein E8E15_004767 [Penicillium rubens]|jgi:hypothetical protein|uniref:uncharacterized protein n=1 Tax=Penicillium rubens TaxID=1108849 RepID=UPI001DD00DEE|nr:uncharacterized protein N7525_009379 [Penicillium rubens]KAF3016958.1 hypothetical protein E8E15_004767 [Penicillium rubens]KAJ5831126.1 hypothetical protein N7525_009379 [Penicillium rubens]